MLGNPMIGGRKKGGPAVTRTAADDVVMSTSQVPDSRTSRTARATEGMKFPANKNKKR